MSAPDKAPVAKLTVSFEGKVLSVWEIPPGATRLIGRGTEVHYQIKSGALSRQHCQLTDTGAALEICDLGSRNGTFVNRKKITKCMLYDGDQIEFGNLLIKVENRYGKRPKPEPEKDKANPKPVTSELDDESTSTMPTLNHSEEASHKKEPAAQDQPNKEERAGKSAENRHEASFTMGKNASADGKPAAPAESAVKATADNKNPAPAKDAGTGAPNKIVADIPTAKRPLWEAELPSGNCQECNKAVTAQALAAFRGVYKGKQIYCISCFCKGAGNFPTIAGYRIVKKLGGGGMGEVYEAIQLTMERPVAFKLMRGLESANEQQVRRFFREAATGGKLIHPNIVNFIDAGKLEGACFLTMEFIDGRDVKQILAERGSLHYLDALRIGYYVAQALDYAHTRFNIVHRDVKPENILVDRSNNIKLTDFGLAKNLEDAGLSGITQSQTGVGTLFYMSPEQIANARFADQRADIYSLGVSLYEMTTGVRPFVADDMMTLIKKIRSETPQPIPDKIPGFPADLWAIIAKAMAKNPDQRFQLAKEFSEVLQAYLLKVAPNYLP